MSEQTRRAFVKRSAGAAVGATVIGALMATEADAHPSEPVVAYVHDGHIEIMTGEREVTVRDRKLAAQIVRAGGN
ncbi:MAG: twin-arginine translocation signal domain-containing protein [Solirubrobacterales bacterium]|nr:twin-arginine translocation signal domain-containing protein [Solirubrobacterales bacterium]